MLTSVFIGDLGLKRSGIDQSVFIWKLDEEHTVVAVATDDMAVTSKQMSNVIRFKLKLQELFNITDLGKMKHFLGFAV
jgi:hypothetical protein